MARKTQSDSTGIAKNYQMDSKKPKEDPKYVKIQLQKPIWQMGLKTWKFQKNYLAVKFDP